MLVHLFVAFILSRDINAEVQNTQHGTERNEKLLPIFSVVTFPNDLCVGTESGSTRNGTCYTSAECDSKGGTSSGSCASGFGVCCVFALSCGGSSAENHTYLIQASATTGFTTPCKYQICKCSADICRIRLDFTTFTLAVPHQGTTKATTLATEEFEAASVGDCYTDTFSVSGQPGSPVICGKNTGQHLIVDACDDCHTINFNIATTSTTRAWTIHITQYTCQEDQNTQGGPPGCLQWFTGTTGRVSSFGFDRTLTVITASAATHLSSQNYQVCFRRESSYCYICYTPKLEGANAAATQSSFGLSIFAGTAATAAASTVDQYCNADRLSLAGKETATNAAIVDISATAQVGALVCGRYMDTANTLTAVATVCTRNYPFVLGVIMDEDENYSVGTVWAADEASAAEAALSPGGIVGFDLYYSQGSC